MVFSIQLSSHSSHEYLNHMQITIYTPFYIVLMKCISPSTVILSSDIGHSAGFQGLSGGD